MRMELPSKQTTPREKGPTVRSAGMMNVIKQLRSTNQSFASLSEAVGVARQYISQWEQVPDEHVADVAEALGIHPGDVRPDLEALYTRLLPLKDTLKLVSGVSTNGIKRTRHYMLASVLPDGSVACAMRADMFAVFDLSRGSPRMYKIKPSRRKAA